MSLRILTALTVLPLLAFASEKRSTPTKFSLYAYGEGIGGLEVFNADGV